MIISHLKPLIGELAQKSSARNLGYPCLLRRIGTREHSTERPALARASSADILEMTDSCQAASTNAVAQLTVTRLSEVRWVSQNVCERFLALFTLLRTARPATVLTNNAKSRLDSKPRA
jgi:hypothetical protein